MKKIMYVCLSAFIALGVVFCVHYGRSIVQHPQYLYISVICGLASVMTTASMVLCIKEKKGKAVNVVYIFSAALCTVILFIATIWLLHFCGVRFQPPPQR